LEIFVFLFFFFFFFFDRALGVHGVYIAHQSPRNTFVLLPGFLRRFTSLLFGKKRKKEKKRRKQRKKKKVLLFGKRFVITNTPMTFSTQKCLPECASQLAGTRLVYDVLVLLETLHCARFADPRSGDNES